MVNEYNERDVYDEIAERWIEEANDDYKKILNKISSSPECNSEPAKRIREYFKDQPYWQHLLLKERKQNHGGVESIDEEYEKLLSEKEQILSSGGFVYGNNVKKLTAMDEKIEGLKVAIKLVDTTAEATD